MPEYLSPNVFVEEISGGNKPIEGVGTSTGAFIGVAEKGPVVGAVYEDDAVGQPVLVTNFSEFVRNFGGFIENAYLAYGVQQFFGEGGGRCYVARTAHFTNASDARTLTARRATIPLSGPRTTLTSALSAGDLSALLANVQGIRNGMQLFIHDDRNSIRVRVTANPTGNTVNIENTQLDSVGVPVPIGAITLPATVIGVALNVNAINEGEWGNSLRVAVRPSGRIQTTLNMPGNITATPAVDAGLAGDRTEAVLTSIEGIESGMTLFISDGTAAARVRVTGIDESANRITFAIVERNDAAKNVGILDGADVFGTILGKVSTVLDGGATAGDGSVFLLSTEGIVPGSILLFVSENVGATGSFVTLPAQAQSRVIVSRVVGQQVFFDGALSSSFPDAATVTTEDFILVVYNRDDVVETFANLSLQDTNQLDFAPNRINKGGARSKYIRVQEPGGEHANDEPARTPNPVRLGSLPGTEGTNGTEVQAADFVGNQAAQTGFFAFDTVDDINIVAAPDAPLRPVILAGMTYCENRGDCFYVGDIARESQTVGEVLDFKKGTGEFAGQQALNSKYGALYWPWVEVLDPLTGGPKLVPPSGAIVGTYAATDVRRGVHKAPAGADDGFLNTAIGIQRVVTKGEHDLLNPQGVNVIRSFPDLGIVVWGARTTSSDPEWRYVNVRRLFLFLEESIQNGTYWAVFEPNDPILWKRLARNVSAFLRVQWLEGKLVGTKPEEAFFVKCDAETNPQDSVDLGRVITLIGVAPSKPAEFVIFRIMQIQPGGGPG